MTPGPPAADDDAPGLDRYALTRSRLYEQYHTVLNAITLLSLKDLAVTVAAAFPAATTVVLGDSDQGDHLTIEYAEDGHGHLIADAVDLADAGVDECATAWNLSTGDIGSDTWKRYARPKPAEHTYRLRLADAAAIPDSAFTPHPPSDQPAPSSPTSPPTSPPASPPPRPPAGPPAGPPNG